MGKKDKAKDKFTRMSGFASVCLDWLIIFGKLGIYKCFSKQ